MKEAIITISKDYGVSVSIVNENGIVSKKTTTLEELQSVMTKDFKLSSGFLPAGTRWYEKSGDKETVYIESPPSIRKVSYDKMPEPGIDTFTIPIPWTLWKFTLTKVPDSPRPSINAFAWAMKMPITPGREASHDLYLLPFSNISGSICWGYSNNTSQFLNGVQEIRHVAKLIDVFWSAPFNRDLDGAKYNLTNIDGSDITGCHSLLEYLNGKTSFPYEILKRAGTFGAQVSSRD